MAFAIANVAILAGIVIEVRPETIAQGSAGAVGYPGVFKKIVAEIKVAQGAGVGQVGSRFFKTARGVNGEAGVTAATVFGLRRWHSRPIVGLRGLI